VKIEALKFAPGNPGLSPLRCELELTTSDDLRRYREEDRTAAYVIRSRHLEQIRRFRDLVVDRGEKHPAKELSKILFGQEKIPVINGRYRDAGQLRRSVQRLMANAVRRGERNIYFIGAEEDMCHALGEKAGMPAPKPVIAARLSADTAAGAAGVLFEMMSYCEEPQDLERRFVGDSIESKLVRQLILRAAQVDDTVLILGDTGTGKEVVARAIHDYSARRGEKFVDVNCGGITQTLLESELFGHERGAFTDAKFKKKGMWQDADKGTLFLDEVGDLPLSDQVKILRALQESRIRPVGSERSIPVNARVIAATNRDLYTMVKNGLFREDLYYRLREFLIRTPVLRDHPDDIPALARFFWRKITKDERDALPEDILAELRSYLWPGNARELKNVLTNLRSLFGTVNLRADHLRAVFMLHGHVPLEGAKTVSGKEIGLQQVQSLNHLKRVEEVVRACEIALTPFSRADRIADHHVAVLQESVRFRLNELEVLCLNPLLFTSEAAFSMVNSFKGKLAYFLGLLQQDARGAMEYWKKDVEGELGRVLPDLSQHLSFLLHSAA
jgi:DNA-binding NtrC family response regulator